jgi:hypothetical protein
LRTQGKEPGDYIVIEEAATNLPKIETHSYSSNNIHPNYVISPAGGSPRKVRPVYSNDYDNLE